MKICPMCKNDTFDTKILIAPLSDISSGSYEEDFKANILICRKCRLIFWYDDIILSKKTRTQRKFKKSCYELPEPTTKKCPHCNGTVFITERIKTLGWRLDPMEWVGDILMQICKGCASATPYEISLRPPMRRHYLHKERVRLAQMFVCPVCQSKNISNNGVIVFWNAVGGDSPKHRTQKIKRSYISLTCKECRCMACFAV